MTDSPFAHQPGVETRSSTGARTFGYDSTGQLLQVTHPGGTATFSYTIGA